MIVARVAALSVVGLALVALLLGGCSNQPEKGRSRNGDGGAPAMPPPPPDQDTGSEPPDNAYPDVEPPDQMPEIEPVNPPMPVPDRGPTIKRSPEPRMAPVRLQIGPRPIVLEAGSVEPGDDLIVVVRDPTGNQVVHEQKFTYTRGAVRLAAASEDSPDLVDWEPPRPGVYVIELWLRDRRVGSQEVELGR